MWDALTITIAALIILFVLVIFTTGGKTGRK